MRTARLVGLSQDGQSLIVATDRGEELAVAADERLRAAVRGGRPRLGHLEFEMETSLSPRDIQTRIRSGASLDDVARVAGLPMDRVERFAAPVLAERDHMAITAMRSSVRRRGETSGHRNLRITVTERLVTRGVDIDTIDWDAFRMDDGRWTVTADYRLGESARHAVFFFDPRGRFSVADNDEARWLLGEHSAAQGPQGRRRPDQTDDAEETADTEPTLDLSDDLALVRATQELDPPTTPATEPTEANQSHETNEATEPTIAVVRALKPVSEPEPPYVAPPTDADPEPAEEPAAPALESPIGTLYEMLGGDGFSEDSIRVYSGLSDASAVPDTEGVGWEPAIVVNYPVEPSRTDEPEPVATADGEHDLPGTDEPGPPDVIVDGDGRAAEVREFEVEAAVVTTSVTEVESVVIATRTVEVETDPDAAPGLIPDPRPPAPAKPPRKKRASVPSWDEIMFGGPRPPS